MATKPTMKRSASTAVVEPKTTKVTVRRLPDTRHVLEPPEVIARAINQEVAAAARDARSAVEHALRAGQLLIDAKAKVGHGRWLPWLAQHCPELSERMAQNYMKLAERVPELPTADAKRVSDMPLRQALMVIAAKPEKHARATPTGVKQVAKPGDVIARRALKALAALAPADLTDPLTLADALQVVVLRLRELPGTSIEGSGNTLH